MSRPTEPTLEVMLAFARQDPSISIGVTLLVGGVLVSGNLINFRRYLERLGGMFERSSGTGGAVAQGIAGGLRTVLQRTEQPDGQPQERKFGRSEAGDDAGEEAPGKDWFYMEDVTLVQGRMPMRLPIWSGRVQDVAGWMIGTLNLT